MVECVCMIVTIIAIVVLLVLVAVFLGLRFIYSLVSSHSQLLPSMKTKALDIFLYLGIAISLIVSVTNLLQIIFTAIDRGIYQVLLFS